MKIHTTCSFCKSPLIRKTQCSMYFCDTHCKAEWQRLNKPVTEAWLRDAYVTQALDCTQIAKLVGRDAKSVWNWLKDFGIETRKRGTTGNHIHSIGVPRVLSDEGRKSLSESARAARLKDGRKPYLKDGVHWLKHEGAVSPNWQGGLTPDRQAFYSSEQWADAVKAVWKRDNATCQRCGASHNTASVRGTFHIHHLESFQVKELRAEVSNLILVCKPCHLFIHSKKNISKEFINESVRPIHNG